MGEDQCYANAGADASANGRAVAMTRPKRSLVVVGDSDTVKK